MDYALKIFIAGLALTGALILVERGVGYLGDMEQRHAVRTQRMDALLCWHEFETGRRPTTADCPEL